MNENEPVTRKGNNTPAPRGGPPKKILRRTFDERLRAVKLHLEEGFTIALVAQEMGVSQPAIDKWLSNYRRHGEAGLKDQPSERGRFFVLTYFSFGLGLFPYRPIQQMGQVSLGAHRQPFGDPP